MSFDSIQNMLEYEASIVEDWPDELQNLVDKGMIEVFYDKNDKPNFKLTRLGKQIYREIDTDLN